MHESKLSPFVRLKLWIIFWAALLAASSIAGSPVVAESRLDIGTGSVTGIYDQIGSSICRFLRMRQVGHDLRCRTVNTGGSAANLRALRDGTLDLVVAQSDLQHHAYHGTSEFEGVGPDTKLRALFSVVPESFTIIAGEDADISTLADLKGERVNIGNPGSGQRSTMNVLMDYLGWTTSDFESTTEVKPSLQAEEICRRRIDAAVYMVAHPNLSVREAMASCNAVIVPVTGPEVEKLIAENAYFVRTAIPVDRYAAEATSVPSFGVTATLVATSATPSELVYQVVKAVFENMEEMRSLLPVFAGLDTEFMLAPHHAVPWHPGALKYFREAGMM